MHVDTVGFVVESGKVAEFARAAHIHDPVHLDREEARRRRLSERAATATHSVVAGHQRDPDAVLRALGMEKSRVVVGGSSWEYHRPLLVGDSVIAQRTVTSDVRRTNRQGTALRIVTLETQLRTPDGEKLMTQIETFIERGNDAPDAKQ